MKECQRIYCESLGCPKNLVDSEIMMAALLKDGAMQVHTPDLADIIIVNTCGFIEPAKAESINTTLELAEYKKTGHCHTLVMTGCLVERYEKELRAELPEVDLFLNLKNFTEISLHLLKKDTIASPMERHLLTPSHYAYLRISDGCNNCCSYCAIPKIRGPLHSRPLDEIVQEAKLLLKNGARELILIAQDTGNYGKDLIGHSQLPELLKALDALSGIFWIRIMYIHPQHISRDLLQTIATSKHICHYLDIPIQHCANRLLQAMNRHITAHDQKKHLQMVRDILPDAVIRTSLIVGFPGETEEEFNELYSYVENFRFEKLGCFMYSAEEGTPAINLSPQIPQEITEKRIEKIMTLQQSISADHLESFIGKIFTVIVDKKINDHVYECRTMYDAPDIDGIVYLEHAEARIGEFVKLRITDSMEYDLFGEPI